MSAHAAVAGVDLHAARGRIEAGAPVDDPVTARIDGDEPDPLRKVAARSALAFSQQSPHRHEALKNPGVPRVRAARPCESGGARVGAPRADRGVQSQASRFLRPAQAGAPPARAKSPPRLWPTIATGPSCATSSRRVSRLSSIRAEQPTFQRMPALRGLRPVLRSQVAIMPSESSPAM